MSIILVILLFGMLIFVHELGHFMVAKLCGVKVEQFTIGFGPAIFKKKLGETLYAIRLIPLGGAVMMKGESDEEKVLVGSKDSDSEDSETEDDAGSFYSAPKYKRFLICIAGAAMNFICGIVILIILMLPVKQVISPTLVDFMDGFQYESADAFQEGDRLYKINDFRIYIYSDVLTALTLGEGENFDFTVIRDGEKVKIENLPLKKEILDEKSGNKLYGFIFGISDMNFGGRIGYAFKSGASFVQSAYKSFGMLITGKVKSDQMMGTIGIAGEMNERAKQSSEDLWYFVAFISINLAIVNMLPIPALDGGKVLFILVELIARKKINPKYESYISLAGLVLILILFVFVTYNDIVRLLR